MSTVSPLLFLILIPLVAAVLVMLGGKSRTVSLFASASNLILLLVLATKFRASEAGFQFVSSFPVVPQLGINFILGADGLSFVMLFLPTAVTLAAVAVARPPVENDRWFYISLLMISAGVIGAFASVDVFLFYMFHELALIPTFLLIGIWGSGDRQAAAWKATIYLATGSFVLLLGLIGLYLLQPLGDRSFDLRHIIKKFGLYGLIRICAPVFPESIQALLPLLLVLIVGNILYVGYVTIAQRKLDTMLGYSSVMHMGYIFLGFAALNVVSLTGASLMLLSHGLTVALLFALCGEIRERTGTLEFSELGGIARATPKLGLAFGFAAMASVGLPGFIGFASELMVFFGAFVGQPTEMRGQTAAAAEVFRFNSIQIVTVCAVWGIVISAIYMLRAYRKIFMGPLPERWSRLPDLAGLPRVAVVLLIGVMLFYGFFPQLLVNLVTPALLQP